MSKQTYSAGPHGRLMLVCGAMVLLGALLTGATFALRGQSTPEDVPRGGSISPASHSEGQSDAATGLRAHLSQGEPAAYSALFSLIALVATVIIAFRTYALSKAIRAGQVAQEQIKMVLEIDSELIKDPSLWIVHGERYRPVPESEGPFEQIISQIKDKGGDDDLIEVVRTCVSQLPPASGKPDEQSEKRYTLRQLKQLALVTRYFNMFDFVHASLVERYVGPPEQFGLDGDRKREEWVAWVNYMRDFFHKNEIAKTAWVEFTARGIYAESFRVFVDTCVKDKAPPGANA
jgi:hypothetical protein